MKKSITEKAINEYNELCFAYGLEHCTVNTEYSEGTENYNLRDMIAELDYYNHTDALMDDEKYEINKFIKKYEKYAKGLKCNVHHCSRKYDTL